MKKRSFFEPLVRALVEPVVGEPVARGLAGRRPLAVVAEPALVVAAAEEFQSPWVELAWVELDWLELAW